MICTLHLLSDSTSIIYFPKATQATSLFLKHIRHSPTSGIPYSLHPLPEMPPPLFIHMANSLISFSSLLKLPSQWDFCWPLKFTLSSSTSKYFISHFLYFLSWKALSNTVSFTLSCLKSFPLLNISSKKTGVLVDFLHCCPH